MERPGGMIVAPEILSVAGGWGREILGPEQEAKRIGIKDYPLYNFGFAVSQPDETVKTIETGVPYDCLLYTSSTRSLCSARARSA